MSTVLFGAYLQLGVLALAIDLKIEHALSISNRPATDPYHYTSGRWLDRDTPHREARHVGFNFTALCAKAVNACTGATKVIRYEKKEGGFNRVFLFYLDNGARVVARVPFHIAGPRRLTTNSEVATMTYIRSFTKIPVPKVLDWSDDGTSIGTEYIIMEQALGVPLHDKWTSMSPHQHMLCVNVTFLMAKMGSLEFPVYGSLYFADAPIDPSLKSNFVKGFCIGPHCGTKYWDCKPGEVRFYAERPPNRGPWADLTSYCSGLIDAGFSRIPKADDPRARLSYRGSLREHLRLLDISNTIIQELIKFPIIKDVAGPILLHPDIHKRNIFVSEDNPSCITAIIDWQSTSIEPAFVYANYTPDFIEDATADIQILENLISSEGISSDADACKVTSVEPPEQEAARKRHHNDVLICRKTFEVVLLGCMNKLHDARAMDETLLMPIRYCDASWRHSAAALRQELIILSQQWNELGLPGHCPYRSTPKELAEHVKKYDDFETAQQLKSFLKRALNAESDGWGPADKWVAAQEENTKLFGLWVESITEPGGSEDRARALWPFGEVSTST
ncbi:kinase-like domain-containing protein [Pyrenochaeta sp. MPI-SDFR-AT-0127]|nr:kinase-like domain-containing protein [Pyrenochaeta sp. MPI-SDFR-AT-0127]